MKIKLLSLTALIALIAFSSCKKSSGSGIAAGEISATINDTFHTFKNVVEIEEVHIGDEEGFLGSVADSSTSPVNGIGIEVVTTTGGALKPITYLDTDTSAHVLIELELNGIEYESAGAHLSPSKISLGGYLQGTFSGKLYEGGDSTSTTTATVTNGKFNFSLY
ncbi:MAG TPA: hypothetical protein VK559_07535 [Ferruginibacter sp.]|nr:hypothetical protein [Ferruginibacter sp.]